MNRLFKICDVTLRDGLQSFPKLFLTVDKLNIYSGLVQSGIKSLEIGSNVSKKLKQMSDIENLLQGISEYHLKNQGIVKPESLRILVPNIKKYEESLKFKNIKMIDTFSLITAASEKFTQKNSNMSISSSLREIDEIIKGDNKYRIYISCCFGCPFEKNNEVDLKNLRGNTIDILCRYIDNPKVSELVISDTIGNFNSKILQDISSVIKNKQKIYLHLHINNWNIPTVLQECLKNGFYNYDVSLGEMGGCPSIKGEVKPNMNNILTLLEGQKIGLVKEGQYNLEILSNIEKCIIYKNF